MPNVAGLLGVGLCLALAMVIPWSAAVRADTDAGAPDVLLEHRITPGAGTLYEIRIEIVRDFGDGSRRKVQTGRLTRMMFGDEASGQATCAQMVELDAPFFAEPDSETQPVSKQDQSKSPPAFVQFTTTRVQSHRVWLAPPAQTAWARRVAGLLVQVTNWPPVPVTAGTGWEVGFEAGTITGQRYYLVEAIKNVRGDELVIVSADAAFDDPVDEGGRRLISATSNVVWSTDDGDVVTLEGQARWRESPRAGAGEVLTRIQIERKRRFKLRDKWRARDRLAVVALAEAINAYRREDHAFALRSLKAFARRHGHSRWEPAADYLRRKIDADRRLAESLPTAELRERLEELIIEWQEAERDGDVEQLDRCRSSMTRITEVNRPELMRLLDDEDEQTRAQACFAMAFGSRPADVALIQSKCDDASARVRRTALSALAVRASPITDTQVLIERLSDPDRGVRQRAAQAIGSCVEKDASEIDKARAALRAGLKDDATRVILAAAWALTQIGTDADLEAIRRAAASAESERLRVSLQQLASPPVPD